MNLPCKQKITRPVTLVKQMVRAYNYLYIAKHETSPITPQDS